jgi:hypothetical protein
MTSKATNKIILGSSYKVNHLQLFNSDWVLDFVMTSVVSITKLRHNPHNPHPEPKPSRPREKHLEGGSLLALARPFALICSRFVGDPVLMVSSWHPDTHYSCIRVRPVSISLGRDPHKPTIIQLSYTCYKTFA